MVLMCCVSAISAASNDTITDELSEIDSGDESLSVSNDEQAGGVDENSALTADENNEEPTMTSNNDDILGENEENVAIITIMAPETVPAGEEFPVNVTITDSNGKPIKWNNNDL